MQINENKINLSRNDNCDSRQVLIITGLSGAGKTTLMRALEDFGFYCVDNLPLPLLSTFLSLVFQSKTNFFKIALGIDARAHNFLHDFIWEVEKVKKQDEEKMALKVIFLQAQDGTLVKRFQETRRNHPLAGTDISISDAIQKERQILEPIKSISDLLLDTDAFNVHDLRSWVRNIFSENLSQKILVNLISFGFKYGVPSESNMVCDLRFLPNPYFEPDLKAHDGKSGLIQKFLFSDSEVQEYWQKLKIFLHYSVQKFYQEGRFFVNISIGCTGGKHRSVAFVEKLSQEYWENTKFLIHHRDLGKE